MFPFVLIWKRNRLELIVLALVCWTLAAAAVLLSIQLAELSPCAGCDVSREFNDAAELGRNLFIGLAVMPLLAGILLGTPIVARDVEDGTAEMMWGLAASRKRVMAALMLAAAAYVLLLIAPLAVAGHLLDGAIEPDLEPMSSLTNLGARGLGLLVRGLADFSLGFLVGAIVGRTLPALLIAAIPAVLTLALWTPIASLGQPAEVVAPLGDHRVAGAVVYEVAYESSDGHLLTRDDVEPLVPKGADMEDWIASNFTVVAVGIPGSRYPDIELRSLLIVGSATLLVSVLGVLVAARRRPY